eukprot:UN2162
MDGRLVSKKKIEGVTRLLLGNLPWKKKNFSELLVYLPSVCLARRRSPLPGSHHGCSPELLIARTPPSQQCKRVACPSSRWTRMMPRVQLGGTTRMPSHQHC